MRIGTICYATMQGIGYLPKWFHDEGVITDVAVMRHSSRVNHTNEWYGPNTLEMAQRPFMKYPSFTRFLENLDAMLFFETPFDWTVLDRCRERKIRTYIVPMYECTPRHCPSKPDRWLCPSLLDCKVFPGNPFLQIPVPRHVEWRQRYQAKRFLHNGGHLGLRGHKGTLEIMQAMEHVRSDITMTIRAQDSAGLAHLIEKVPSIVKDPRVELVRGDLPYEHLHAEHDVFIMAEKYNGLSLPLLEARAAGCVVMTSERFPMTEWLPLDPLIPVERYSRECISGAYLEYDEAHVDPWTIARKIDEVAGWSQAKVMAYSEDGKAWAERNSWERLKPQWLEALST